MLGAIACILLAATPLTAQLRVAVVVGASAGDWSLSTGTSEGQQSITAPAAGLSFGVKADAALSLQPEVLYVNKGSSLIFGGNVRIDFRVHYLELPLLLKFSVANTGTVRPYLLVGPELGIRAACSTRATNSPANGGEVFVEPCTSGFNGSIVQDEPDRFDTGVMFGAGVTVGRFSGSVRYDRGLADIFSRYRTSSSETTRNSTWLALVAVRL